MSSSAVGEHEFHALRVPPASRLIPGRAFPAPAMPRKKPQSATWDSRYWVEDEPVPVPRGPSTAEAMRQAILPTPAQAGDRYWLVLQVAADFMIATTILGAVICLLAHAARFLPAIEASAALTYGALLTLLGHSEGLYRSDASKDMETIILGKAVAWSTLLAVAALCTPGFLPVLALVISAPLGYFSLLAWRRWQRRRAQRHLTCAARNILIAGAGITGRTLAAQLGRDGLRRQIVRGFLDDKEEIAGDVLGRTEDLARIARAEFIDEVILTHVAPDVARRLVREARRHHLDIKALPDLLGLESSPAGPEQGADVPLLTLHQEPIPGASLLAKRMVDLIVSAAMLALCAPLFAVIALLIKLDSRGPVLYRAGRVGKKGRTFLCFKFRTMCCGAEALQETLRAQNERDGAFFKMAADPRITRLGRFLRRYSLDELPQLFNVLKGEMSLVGPRPHPTNDCSRYRLQDLRRLDVVPGITGLWQVTARRDPSFERSMALDLEYIERWNFWTDLKLLWRSAWVVVQGTGA